MIRGCFASLEKLVTNAFSGSVELTRPFGQLNIKTEDLASIPDNQKEAFVPVTAGLSFKNLYTGFNAATGDLLGEPTSVAYKAASDVVDANGNPDCGLSLCTEYSGRTTFGKYDACRIQRCRWTDYHERPE